MSSTNWISCARIMCELMDYLLHITEISIIDVWSIVTAGSNMEINTTIACLIGLFSTFNKEVKKFS